MVTLNEIKLNNLSKEEIDELGKVMYRNSKENKDWTIGELIYNSLYEVKPKLANLIRSTEYDPINKDYKRYLGILILLTNPKEYKE